MIKEATKFDIIVDILRRNRHISDFLKDDEEIYEIANCIVECLEGLEKIKALTSAMTSADSAETVVESLVEIGTEFGYINAHIHLPKIFRVYVKAMEL